MHVKPNLPKWATKLAKKDQTIRAKMAAQDQRAYVDRNKDPDRVDIQRRIKLTDDITIKSGEWKNARGTESFHVELADEGKTSHHSAKRGNKVSLDTSFWDSDGAYVEQQLSYNDATGAITFLKEGRTY